MRQYKRRQNWTDKVRENRTRQDKTRQETVDTTSAI